ncbi:MAG: choice-of-anchor J domain-containing protein [Bacteroidales bacterium]|nr:choice-of-anchor J domain-containing protein [Bacteroidales bacterium]
MRKIYSLGVLLLVVTMSFGQIAQKESLSCQYSSSKFVDKVPVNKHVVSLTRDGLALFQDFSSTLFPPQGWDTIQGAESVDLQHWHRSTDVPQNCEGEFSYAAVQYANSDQVIRNQDEWLISPSFVVPAGASRLFFDYYSNPGWFVADWGSFNNVDNADINIKVSTDGGTNWTTIWNDDEYSAAVGGASGFPQLTWSTISVNMSAYAGQSVKVAFQYVGIDAAMFYLDNIFVDVAIPQDFELTDARVNFNSKYVNYGYNGNFSHFPRREITSDSKVCFEGVATNYGTEAVTVNLVAKVFDPSDQQIFSYTFSSETVPAATYVNGVYHPSVDTIVYYTESSTAGSYSVIQASLFSMSNMTNDGTYRFEVSLQPASGTYSNQNNRNLSVNRYATISDDCLYSRDDANYTQGSYYEACNPQWHNFSAFGTPYQIYSTSDAINSVEAYITGATNGATFHYEIFNVDENDTYTSVFTTESYTINTSTFTPGFIKLFSENPLTFTNMSLDFQEIVVAVVVENNKRVRVGIDESVQPGAFENKAFDGTSWYRITGTDGILMIRTYVCEQGSYITVTSADPQQGTTTGTGRYDIGSTATISAIPNEGFRFLSWTDGNTDNPRNVIVEQDATYTATFEAIPTFIVTAASNNDSFGTVTGGGTYYEGTVVTITANANDGYYFVSWNDGTTTNPRTVTVTQNIVLIATFAVRTTVNITALSANEEYGTVTGGGEHLIGSTVTLIAHPNSGYLFESWNDGNTDNPRQFVATEDAMYIATFIYDDSGVDEFESASVALFPNPAGDVLNVTAGETIEKIAIVSVAGQLVYEAEVNADNVVLDLSAFAKGMYFMKVYGKDSATIGLQKFVKE